MISASLLRINIFFSSFLCFWFFYSFVFSFFWFGNVKTIKGNVNLYLSHRWSMHLLYILKVANFIKMKIIKPKYKSALIWYRRKEQLQNRKLYNENEWKKWKLIWYNFIISFLWEYKTFNTRIFFLIFFVLFFLFILKLIYMD